jgi:hypothetical protein
MQPAERTIATVHDIKKLKLGKMPARVSLRTPLLRRYLAPDMPPPPVSVNWGAAVKQPWGMLKNDELGDCTAAAAAHLIQLWSANNIPAGSAGEITITDDEVVLFYEQTCGYSPAKPATDQGGIELDILKWWQANNFGGFAHIDSFASVSPQNTNFVKSAIYLMGGAYIGLSLPASAQTQAVWDLPPGGMSGAGAPGSWGGHAVAIIGYDETTLTCVTWGEPWKMTWSFFLTYCDEFYAILSPLWYAPFTTPVGVDIAALTKDMDQFQGNDIPTPPSDTPIDPPVPGSVPPVKPTAKEMLLEVHVGNITVSLGQALASLLYIIIGTTLFWLGKFDFQALVTWLGLALTVTGAAAHMKTLNDSNKATDNYGDQIDRIIEVLKKRQP